eukprot:scaffold73021_cov61-Phaeocystis_antarctica.AAC.9
MARHRVVGRLRAEGAQDRRCPVPTARAARSQRCHSREGQAQGSPAQARVVSLWSGGVEPTLTGAAGWRFDRAAARGSGVHVLAPVLLRQRYTHGTSRHPRPRRMQPRRVHRARVVHVRQAQASAPRAALSELATEAAATAVATKTAARAVDSVAVARAVAAEVARAACLEVGSVHVNTAPCQPPVPRARAVVVRMQLRPARVRGLLPAVAVVAKRIDDLASVRCGGGLYRLGCGGGLYRVCPAVPLSHAATLAVSACQCGRQHEQARAHPTRTTR